MSSIESRPLILHALSCGIMLWAFKQLDTLPMHKFIKMDRGGHWQFLTIQCLAVACFTMALGAWADLFPSQTGIRKFRRKLLMVSLPLSIVVSTIYWGLILVAPHLILPPAPGFESTPSASSAAPPLARVPIFLDLALHASPVVSLLSEFLLFQTPYSSYDMSYTAPALLIIAGIWYSSFAEYCASYNQVFPYPFLTYSPFEVRIGIYTFTTLLAFLAFWTINSFHPRKR